MMKPAIILLLLLALPLIALTQEIKSENATNSPQSKSLEHGAINLSKLVNVDTFKISILPPSSGVQFYRKGIVFLTRVKTSRRMTESHVSFGAVDACYAVLNDSTLKNQKTFSPTFSFPFPCEAITFSRNFDTMYYTKYSRNDKSEKIYRSIFSKKAEDQGNWIREDIPVNFCSGKSSYTHPSLSYDGSIIIFASNRPGSLGGMDLFLSKNIAGSWSESSNIGKIVNTKSNELFPYLDSKSNLYFSSDRPGGYGGYDIYACKFRNGSWGKPINLSGPINTKFDDVAFKVNPLNEKSAFYTVKHKSIRLPDQLYLAVINSDYDYSYPQIITNSDNNEFVPFMTMTGFIADSVKKTTSLIKLKTGNIVQKTDTGFTLTETKKEKNPAVIKNKTEKTELTNSKKKAGLSAGSNEDKISVQKASENNEIVLFRVQLLVSGTPKGTLKIDIDNQTYNTYEYFYKSAYCTCIGEFTTLSPAIKLQNACRKSGYSQAFVVAFKNNVRSQDMSLFKKYLY